MTKVMVEWIGQILLRQPWELPWVTMWKCPSVGIESLFFFLVWDKSFFLTLSTTSLTLHCSKLWFSAVQTEEKRLIRRELTVVWGTQHNKTLVVWHRVSLNSALPVLSVSGGAHAACFQPRNWAGPDTKVVGSWFMCHYSHSNAGGSAWSLWSKDGLARAGPIFVLCCPAVTTFESGQSRNWTVLPWSCWF